MEIPAFAGGSGFASREAMVDVALLLGVSLLAGGMVAISPVPTAVAAVVSLTLLRSRITWFGCALSIGALGMSAFRAGRAVADHDRERAEVRAALGGPVRCFAEGRVASSPVLMRSAPTLVPASGDPPELVAGWDADVARLECEGRAVEKTFRARFYGGPDDLRRGDRVEIIGKLAPLQLFHNEDLGDPRPAAIRRGTLASGGTEDVRLIARAWGPTAMIDRFRARVRGRIEATFAPDAAPMARALVLGEADLDAADNQAFRASGLAHLLAVSGTHLVLVVAGAVAACTALLRRMTALSARWDVGRISAALGVTFSWIYADFAGGSGSARRAAAMLSFALGARVFGRRPDGPRAFGLSLAGAALFDPLIAFDLSFLLSAAATAGLMVLQAPLAASMGTVGAAMARSFRRAISAAFPAPIDGAATDGASSLTAGARPAPAATAVSGARAAPSSTSSRVVAAISGAVATTLAATIGCAPLIAFLAPTLPVGGVPANLLAVPLGELLALPLCLVHVFLSGFPLVERGAALAASGSLLLVRTIARATEQVSWLALPVPPPSAWQCAVLWCGGLAFGWGPRRARIATAFGVSALLLLCEFDLRRQGAPHGKLRVTVLDIGQGDASLVDLPDGRAFLVDAGGMVGSPIDTGQAVIDPVLRVRRRGSLVGAVLSHPHPDHFGGLASALARIRVTEFWDSGQGEHEGAGPVYASLLASLRARGVAIVHPASLCGRPRVFGGATIDLLAPCPGPVPFINANDNSMVMRIAYGARAALLVGDAEREEEEKLLAHAAGPLRADFLKVGHHGSRTSSSPEFLRAVGPEHAAISCGVRNRFGHPHPITLAHLSAVTRVWRTDLDGSVRWETDGQSSRVVTAKGARFQALFTNERPF
jgi:competence protein ComEC